MNFNPVYEGGGTARRAVGCDHCASAAPDGYGLPRTMGGRVAVGDEQVSEPNMAMTEAELTRLTKQVGRAMVAVAGPRWQKLRAEYRSVGRHVEVDLIVTGADGEPVSVRPPTEMVEGLRTLRGGMYRAGRGTWISAVYEIEPPGDYAVEFEPDIEPEWRRVPPPIGFLDELRFFPREDSHIPEWLRERLAQAAPPQAPPGPQHTPAGPQAPPGPHAPAGPPVPPGAPHPSVPQHPGQPGPHPPGPSRPVPPGPSGRPHPGEPRGPMPPFPPGPPQPGPQHPGQPGPQQSPPPPAQPQPGPQTPPWGQPQPGPPTPPWGHPQQPQQPGWTPPPNR